MISPQFLPQFLRQFLWKITRGMKTEIAEKSHDSRQEIKLDRLLRHKIIWSEKSLHATIHSTAVCIFFYFIIPLAGLPGVAWAFTTLKYYVYAHPGAPPKFLTSPRPAPGCPRPTCKVSALYLENCMNALRQRDRQRQTDNPLYRYRL